MIVEYLIHNRTKITPLSHNGMEHQVCKSTSI